MEGRVLMPWESKTVEELRREFVLSAQDNINFSALCLVHYAENMV